jgi:hypothetical protein
MPSTVKGSNRCAPAGVNVSMSGPHPTRNATAPNIHNEVTARIIFLLELDQDQIGFQYARRPASGVEADQADSGS